MIWFDLKSYALTVCMLDLLTVNIMNNIILYNPCVCVREQARDCERERCGNVIFLKDKCFISFRLLF